METRHHDFHCSVDQRTILHSLTLMYPLLFLKSKKIKPWFFLHLNHLQDGLATGSKLKNVSTNYLLYSRNASCKFHSFLRRTKTIFPQGFWSRIESRYTEHMILHHSNMCLNTSETVLSYYRHIDITRIITAEYF